MGNSEREIVKTLFAEALGVPVDRRRTFVERSSSSEPIQREVLTLLEKHEEASVFFGELGEGSCPLVKTRKARKTRKQTETWKNKIE
ncbi:MAG TPA: hypothetical protein VMO47_04575 [Rhodothermales bacterium]|nr:hypothetical protein [Rhodothermales bacterium]